MSVPAQVAELESWCALPGTTGDHPGPDLFTEVNAEWHAARPDVPASLLQALAKDEERRLAVLLARRTGLPAAATAEGPAVVPRLHEVFVTGFDPAGERAACQPDLAALASAGTEAALLDMLADLTRAGRASPFHLDVRLTREGEAVVVPAVHAPPLPPTDFGCGQRVEAYVRHMSAMVGHIGGTLDDERFAGVVALDRALWCDKAPEAALAEFPWDTFLHRAVEPRSRPWSSRIGTATRRRAAAWWSGSLEARRDWMTSRLAYDLGPFASEEALVRNSRFFAGRVLGVTTPRPRAARFVSFVRTVAPHDLARLYVADRHNDAVLDQARTVVEALRDQAVAWAAAHGRPDGHDTRVLREVVVELGHQPGTDGARPDDGERRIGPSVCDAIASARRAETTRRLATIDDPGRAAEWRIPPFAAAAYYQGSANKIVVPWALLRAPVLGPDLPDVQVYALFGTLVAHEIAHAVLPTLAAGWTEFVERAALAGVLARLPATSGSAPGHERRPSHERELAADAVGFLWAYRAYLQQAHSVDPCSTAGGQAGIDTRFLRYWATRWRGAHPTHRAGFGHLDNHPPAELRCNIAPTYAQETFS